MTAPGHDGFLRRWSRRKVQARTSQVPDDAPQPGLPAAVPADAGAGGVEAPAELPPLTLDDVRALTSESDFAPFVARQVAPEVKNAALKKLFSDPRYNVMDGLDTYIDDYSRMETLPAPMLRRLASARALAMFDSADEAPARQALPGQDAVPPQVPGPPDAPAPAAQASGMPDAESAAGIESESDSGSGPEPDPSAAAVRRG